MLYKHIRTCRHLYNEANKKPVKIFYSTISDSYIYDGCAMSIQDDENPDKKYLVIYNSFFNDIYADNVRSNVYDKIDKILLNNYGCYCVFDVDAYGNTDYYSRVFNYVYAVPYNIDEGYNIFLKANNKIISPVCRKLSIDLNSSMAKYLYVMTNASGNFFVWALNQVFGHQRSSWMIRQIMLWYNKYSHLSGELSKKTITAYVSFRDIIKLMDEMSHIKMMKRANDTINMFNTAQKRILKNADKSDDDINVLNRFNVLSKEKKLNFIRKMSTVEDYNEIMKEMSHLIKVHFKWNKESFVDYIKNTENLDYEIIKEGDNFFVIEVKDYETIKRITKSTNWCISKNKKYWNDYVGNRTDSRQFVILDFSRKEDDAESIIGFTVRTGNGVTNAHNFFNSDLMRRRDECGTIVSLMDVYEGKSSIDRILERYGIDVSKLLGKSCFPFEFSRDGFLSHIEKIIGKNYSIISDCNNKLVVSIRDRKVGEIFGDSYYTLYREDYIDCKHIVFLDFSKNKDRMYVCAVIKDGFEEIVSLLCNENFRQIRQGKFDSLLCEYKLPYDTICRTTDNILRISRYMSDFEHIILNEMLSDKSIKEELLDYIKEKGDLLDDQFLYDTFSHCAFGMYSKDMFDVFYNNDILVGDLFKDKHFLSSLLRTALNKMAQRRTTIPTENELKRFYNGMLNIDDAYSIMYYIIADNIMQNEKDLSVFNDCVSYCTYLLGSCKWGIAKYVINNVLSKAKESDFENPVVRICIEYVFKNTPVFDEEKKYICNKFKAHFSESQAF